MTASTRDAALALCDACCLAGGYVAALGVLSLCLWSPPAGAALVAGGGVLFALGAVAGLLLGEGVGDADDD